MTEQLLQQQLESPSGTGRVEPRPETQPVSYRHQQTGCQPANPFSLADRARLATAPIPTRTVPGGPRAERRVCLLVVVAETADRC